MKIKIRPTYQAEKVDKIKIPYQQIASKPYTSLISTHKCMNLIFVEHNRMFINLLKMVQKRKELDLDRVLFTTHLKALFTHRLLML